MGISDKKWKGKKIVVLFCMIFCHLLDDYYLQGWLASAKQKNGGKRTIQIRYISTTISWR